jgi:hypothetical protein
MALSIRQPWAWLIMNAGKDIENRNWPTKFRGRVLIHAAKGCTVDEYDSVYEWLSDEFEDAFCEAMPDLKAIERGGIIGSVEIVDCVTSSSSSWFFGRYGFVLRNPRVLPFTPCKGRLGFFDVSLPELEAN